MAALFLFITISYRVLELQSNFYFLPEYKFPELFFYIFYSRIKEQNDQNYEQ